MGAQVQTLPSASPADQVHRQHRLVLRRNERPTLNRRIHQNRLPPGYPRLACCRCGPRPSLPRLAGRCAEGYIGVDVFFVISGFLIMGLLIKDIDQTGRLSIPHFYARRSEGCLPAATTVLIAIAIVSIFLLPKIR